MEENKKKVNQESDKLDNVEKVVEEAEKKQEREDEGFDDKLKRVVLAGVGAVANLVEKSKEAISEFADRDSVSEMASKGEETVEKVKTAGGAVVEKAKEVGGTALEKVKEVGGAAVEKVKEVGGSAVEKVKEVGGNAVEKVKEVGGDTIEKVKQKWDESDLKNSVSNRTDKLNKMARSVHDLDAEEREVYRQLLDRMDSGLDEDGNLLQSDEEFEFGKTTPSDDAVVKSHGTKDATPVTPDDENNLNKIKANDVNDHIPQSVPPEY